jgi:hypothetical protein
VGAKKKRKPSEYNIFMGECMRGGKDMKACAADYKSSGRHRESYEKEKEKEEDEKEFIGIFTSDRCPSCEKVKIELEEKLNGEEIVELNVTKDKDANKLYQLAGANKKGIPSFARFTKDKVCLLNDDLEEESCAAIEKGKERKKEKRESHSSNVQMPGVKNVYLITSAGCPSCDMVEGELKSDIDQGFIQVLDIQESDFGADLVMKLHIIDVPKMVYEKTDGTFEIVRT